MSREYFEKKAKEIGFVRPKRRLRKLDWVLPVFVLIFGVFIFVLNIYLKIRKKIIIGRIEGGIGDSLVLTSFILELNKNKKYNKYKLILYSRYPEIFLNNPAINKLIDYNKLNNLHKIILILILRTSDIFKFRQIIHFDGSYSVRFYKFQQRKHLIDGLLNDKYYFSLLKKKCAKIYFSDLEIKTYKSKFKYLPEDYYLILSEVTNWMHTKNWGFEKMQNLVNKMPDINWVQIGTIKERKLNNTKLDLRDKTNLRELFYIVKNCKAIVCTEGMYTHLSSAFNKKCFTIFSGYHPPEISEYPNVIPITLNPQMSCAYCWLDDCPFYKEPKCIKDISVEQVINTIKSKKL